MYMKVNQIARQNNIEVKKNNYTTILKSNASYIFKSSIYKMYYN